jgi:hypothetical protein
MLNETERGSATTMVNLARNSKFTIVYLVKTNIARLYEPTT